MSQTYRKYIRFISKKIYDIVWSCYTVDFPEGSVFKYGRLSDCPIFLQLENTRVSSKITKSLFLRNLVGWLLREVLVSVVCMKIYCLVHSLGGFSISLVLPFNICIYVSVRKIRWGGGTNNIKKNTYNSVKKNVV